MTKKATWIVYYNHIYSDGYYPDYRNKINLKPRGWTHALAEGSLRRNFNSEQMYEGPRKSEETMRLYLKELFNKYKKNGYLKNFKLFKTYKKDARSFL